MNVTPLFDLHRELGAKIVPFAGWKMPVSYADMREEHLLVRRAVGCFDISHMGRVHLRGPEAVAFADWVQTNAIARLEPGTIRYGVLCDERGLCLDDLLVYREEEGAMLVVNASNHERDLAHLRRLAEGKQVELVDESQATAMLAVQGPRAVDVLARIGLAAAGELKYYRFTRIPVAGLGEVHVSRTGYTGEDGFELIVPNAHAPDLMRRALDAGQEFGIGPCGLGARDTLRLEAGMALYGHEIDEKTNPLEARLDFAVRLKNRDFHGAEALRAVKAAGPARLLIGLSCEGRRIPRQGSEVLLDDEVIGAVCSGTLSPTLEKNIATALVRSEAVDRLDEGRFEISIRGHRAPAHRCELPFYQRPKA